MMTQGYPVDHAGLPTIVLAKITVGVKVHSTEEYNSPPFSSLEAFSHVERRKTEQYIAVRQLVSSARSSSQRSTLRSSRRAFPVRVHSRKSSGVTNFPSLRAKSSIE